MGVLWEDCGNVMGNTLGILLNTVGILCADHANTMGMLWEYSGNTMGMQC